MDIKPPIKKRASSDSVLDTLPPVVFQETPLHKKNASPSFRARVTSRQGIYFMSACVAVLLVAASLSTAIWYQWALSPRSHDTNKVRVVIEPGDTSAGIAENLYDHKLIRSRVAFNLYTQLSGARSKLQAGGYVLAPNQGVKNMVEHMVNGKTDEFNITILPGLTLDELRTQFLADGFSDAEITEAFSATYSHPLLATRPSGASLEGYIYPETYRMSANQSLQELLTRSFDQMYHVLQEKQYLESFTKQNLTIHQGLTLASIVQKEVKNPSDQKQVAQVFLKRLHDGMQLGSDVTYMYAAKSMHVPPTPSLDSPYNTRKYVGLPPGPIANMNPSALDAVAFPAPGDFVYFVAGDDGSTYFAHTEAEHSANIAAHCKALCQ